MNMTGTKQSLASQTHLGGEACNHDEASLREAHEELARRAATASICADMTHFSGDMSLEEVVAKFTGIPLQDVPAALALADAKTP